MAELDRALREGDQRPGQDLLTVIDPAVDPHDMSLQDFMRVYALNLKHDIAGVPPGRSLFVTDDGPSRRGTEVYIALRKKLRGPIPHYAILPSVPAACAELGCADLSDHFRDWPQLRGFLTPR